jgi:hypothetical protein
LALHNSRTEPPPLEQLPAVAASVTMNTFPTLPPADGRFPTVVSGGRHWPPEKLLYPVQVFVPATVAKPLVSAVGFFHVLVALQYQRS